MRSYHEDRQRLKDRKAEIAAINEVNKQYAKEQRDRYLSDLDDQKRRKQIQFENFYKWKDKVKYQLMKKALYEICTQSIENISKRERAICESLVSQYVKDYEHNKLMNTMKYSNNWLLRSIYEKAKETYDDVTKDVKAGDPRTESVPKNAIEDFWKKVDTVDDVADMTNLIYMRVSNAEEDFVNKTQMDKEDVNTVLQQTSDRVKSAQDSNDDDYAEMVEEAETRLAKQKIYNIQHSNDHNIFKKTVMSLSEAVLKNPVLSNEYRENNGRLNMNKIIESSRCIYTLLEMVSTLQLEKVDDKYIDNTLRSINS